MAKVFIDTSFLIAFSNTNDKNHEFAEKILREMTNEISLLVTNEFVMLEFLTYIERKIDYSTAVKSWGEFIENEMFLLETDKPKISNLAWQRYSDQYNDSKPFSFVDCLIIETCFEDNIVEMLSFDVKLKNYNLKS